MWKRWIVFLSAFCLSLILLALLNNKFKSDSLQSEVKPNSQEIPSNQVISGNSSTVKSKYSLSVEHRDLFKDLLIKFRDAVAANDKGTVASLLNYPVEIEFINKRKNRYYKEVRDEAEFLQDYNKIFDESFKRCVEQTDPNKLLFSSSGDVFVFPQVRMELFHKNNGASFEAKVIRLSRCEL